MGEVIDMSAAQQIEGPAELRAARLDLLRRMGLATSNVFGADIVDLRKALDPDTDFVATFEYSTHIGDDRTIVIVRIAPEPDGMLDIAVRTRREPILEDEADPTP